MLSGRMHHEGPASAARQISIAAFRPLPIQFTVPASFGLTVAALITHRLATGSYWAFGGNATWARTLSASAVGVALVPIAYVVLPGVTAADPRALNWGF